MLLRRPPCLHQFRTTTVDIALVSESRGGGDLKVMSNSWAHVSCDEIVAILTFVMHPVLLPSIHLKKQNASRSFSRRRSFDPTGGADDLQLLLRINLRDLSRRIRTFVRWSAHSSLGFTTDLAMSSKCLTLPVARVAWEASTMPAIMVSSRVPHLRRCAHSAQRLRWDIYRFL